MVARGHGRVATRVPGKVVDLRCPLCKSKFRETVDRMIMMGEPTSEILAYCEAKHIQIDKRGLELHKDKHWTAYMVNPDSIEGAKYLNPRVLSLTEYEDKVVETNKAVISRDLDKVSQLADLMSQQDELISLSVAGIEENDYSPSAIRVAKECMDSKLKSITLLSKLDGDIQEGGNTQVNVQFNNNVVSQVREFVKAIPLERKKELLVELDKKRSEGANWEADYYGDDPGEVEEEGESAE